MWFKIWLHFSARLYPVNRDIITHRVKTISYWDCDRMIGLFDLFESSTKQCWLVDSIKSLVPFSRWYQHQRQNICRSYHHLILLSSTSMISLSLRLADNFFKWQLCTALCRANINIHLTMKYWLLLRSVVSAISY